MVADAHAGPAVLHLRANLDRGARKGKLDRVGEDVAEDGVRQGHSLGKQQEIGGLLFYRHLFGLQSVLREEQGLVQGSPQGNRL